MSLNSLDLVKFYYCKPKSTGRVSLIKKQTICETTGNIYRFLKKGFLELTNLSSTLNKTIQMINYWVAFS
jgi:hypothetical protein